MISLAKAVRGWLTIVLVCLALIPVNICQLMTLFVLPFSRRRFMQLNMAIKQFYCGFVAQGAGWCGNSLIVTGDLPRQENAIVFANHQSMIDIILLWRWSYDAQTVGWIKWFAKDVLKYVPGLGWGMMFVNTLFVKRDWAKDAGSIRATFAKLREQKLPTWLVIFPEGTRMKPSKFASSRAYAQRKGLPVFDHVLIPRGKGIHACLQGMSGHLAAVYDVTIQYDGGVPSALHFFTVGGYKARLHAIRHEISSIPDRERDLNQWLLGVFVKKDQMMAEGLHKLMVGSEL
jgi:1-acyl-sn-glycerol-3-phosphate acyltransferase